jgi:hypothetical protein
MWQVDARAMLAAFPHHWEDGVPVCLVVHTDSDGDMGTFRMVLQGGKSVLQCTACGAVVGGVQGAESHVYTGKPTRNAKEHFHVYGTQLSLSALIDRINDIRAIKCPAQPQPRVVDVLVGGGGAPAPALAGIAATSDGSGGVRMEGDVAANGAAPAHMDAAIAPMPLGRVSRS